MVFQHKYLEELEKDKFSLIEDVKTVKVGNEMAVTLSIGIGYNAAARRPARGPQGRSARELIEGRERVLIMGHRIADVDSLELQSESIAARVLESRHILS